MKKKEGRRIFRKSLTLKLLSMFLFSLGVSLAVSYVLHLMFFQPYYLEHCEKRLLSIYLKVEEIVSQEDFNDQIMDLDYQEQVDITIVDSRLRYALYSNSKTPMSDQRLTLDLHTLITKNLEIIEDDYLCVESSEDSTHPRLFFVKILSNGKYCVLTQPWEPLESNMNVMSQFHIMVGGLACCLAIVTTLFFSRQFTKPIIEISKATQGLSQLDFQQEITYQSEDELGELASGINTLSRTLEEHRLALKNEIEFQKVLSQNMSHELKTPISIMKGYLEGIVHGVVDTEEGKQEYLQVVLEECDRMTSLIDRMLHLSKLTSFQEQGLDKESFSGTIFAKNIQAHSLALLQQHNLTLKEEISTVTLWGNLDLLVQAVGNFISNGVKYGDGKEIVLRIGEEEKCHTLSVYNTGAPVPQGEIKRIFNVFYMLDKARSRHLHSHGLGLAVCKTIAELHHGTAYCQVAEGGMVFTIKIPKE